MSQEPDQGESRSRRDGPTAHRHSRRKFRADVDVAEWDGPKTRYDIAKEFTAALIVVTLVTVVLAALLSSPDKKPVTLKSWSLSDPVDFVATAITELDGTSSTATYGPPYTSTPGAGQKIGPVSLQRIPGVTIPIDTAEDFVVRPLGTLVDEAGVAKALSSFNAASSIQRAAWESAYEKAVSKAVFKGGQLIVPQASYGPVGTMISALLAMARSGSLDGAVQSSPEFYGTDYTKPLLFLSDGSYLAGLANKDHLQGSQWGMTNETGSYPGQAWLWLYTMWYQISPFSSSGNADALIWGVMAILTLGLVFVPFIPVVRSIPRCSRIYRLIWRDHYRSTTRN